jgi:hypothetical protein
VQLALWVPKEQWVPLVHKEYKDPRVSKVQLVLPELLVLQELQEPMVPTVRMGLQE